MIHTFRDPRSSIECHSCGKPLDGIPMERGDFLFIHDDAAEHPHSIHPPTNQEQQ